MTTSSQDSCELLRACAQSYMFLQNLARDIRRHDHVAKVDFCQSMFGPDADEWPGSPVGFSWDVEVTFSDSIEETYTFDVIFDAKWRVTGERSKTGAYGPETDESIYEASSDSLVDCIEMIRQGTVAFVDYCWKRTASDA